MKIRSWVISAALLVPSHAMASTQTGKVTWVAIGTTPPTAFVIDDGTRASKPACATDNAWVIPPTTDPSSQQILSGVLTAFAAGKTVTANGTGACSSLQPNREQIGYITITP